MRIRNLIILVLTGFLLLITAGATFFGYQIWRHSLDSALDRELFTAATLAKDVLPAGYHDRIMGKDSVTDAEYLQIVDRFNAICKQTGIEYLWSLMILDGKIVFTSGTSPGKDASLRDQAGFLEPHSAPESYARAFETMQPQYQVNNDKWGRIRAVLLPFYDAQGRKYLIGASRRMQAVDEQTQAILNSSMLFGGGVIVLGGVIAYFLANSLARPIDQLEEAASKIASGDFSGDAAVLSHILTYSEVDSLANSFDLMKQTVRTREADLQKSEAQYRLLTENIQDVVWVMDVETMYFRYVSPSVQRLRGYTPEEVLAEPVTLALSAEAGAYITELTRSRAQEVYTNPESSSKFYTNEIEQLCKDGSTVWTEVVTSYYVNSENGRVEVRGVTRDISERKLAEALLRKSEEKFSKVFHHNQVAMSLSSLQEGRYIDVNPEFLRMAGRSYEEVIGHSALELDMWVHLEQRDQVLSALKAQGAVYNFEVDIRTKSGEILTLVWAADMIVVDDVVCMLVSAIDISDRKRAEGKINAQLNELRRWQNVMLGREDRILELKYEVNQLLAESGKPARYAQASNEGF